MLAWLIRVDLAGESLWLIYERSVRYLIILFIRTITDTSFFFVQNLQIDHMALFNKLEFELTFFIIFSSLLIFIKRSHHNLAKIIFIERFLYFDG